MDARQAPRRRVCWTPDLARLFDEAVESLGGIDAATPNAIRRAMNADLTVNSIKSRLQKLRLTSRLPCGVGRSSDPTIMDQTRELSEQLDAELGKIHW